MTPRCTKIIKSRVSVLHLKLEMAKCKLSSLRKTAVITGQLTIFTIYPDAGDQTETCPAASLIPSLCRLGQAEERHVPSLSDQNTKHPAEQLLHTDRTGVLSLSAHHIQNLCRGKSPTLPQPAPFTSDSTGPNFSSVCKKLCGRGLAMQPGLSG